MRGFAVSKGKKTRTAIYHPPKSYLVVTVSPEGVVATAVETKEEARILASKKTIKVSMQEAISDSSAELGAHSKSNSFLTRASAVTNSRMQASETRLGRGRANQFGSCPKLPTNTKATPLSLAQDFSSRSMLIILDSRSDAGSAVLVIFVRRRLAVKGSYVHFAPPF